MITNSGFNSLQLLFQLPFDSPLTSVTAIMEEIYPCFPAPGGGSRQQVRLRLPSGGCVDCHIFDQRQEIAMSFHGGVIRITATPNSKKALVWERAKSEKPSAKIGTLVARSRHASSIELFQFAQASQLGITEFGFTRAAPLATPPLSFQPSSDSSQAPSLNSSATAPTACINKPDTKPDGVKEISALTAQFAACLGVARRELGATADPEDIRFTAREIFKMISQREAH